MQFLPLPTADNADLRTALEIEEAANRGGLSSFPTDLPWWHGLPDIWSARLWQPSCSLGFFVVVAPAFGARLAAVESAS